MIVGWLQERMHNCLRIAESRAGQDQTEWLEDAANFAEAADEIERLRRPAPAADGRVEMLEHHLREMLSILGNMPRYGITSGNATSMDAAWKALKNSRSALASDTATRRKGKRA